MAKPDTARTIVSLDQQQLPANYFGFYVQKLQSTLKAFADPRTFREPRRGKGLCPPGNDHGRQPPFVAVKLPDPLRQWSELGGLYPPGRLVGRPQPRSIEVLQKAALRRVRLSHITYLPDVSRIR